MHFNFRSIIQFDHPVHYTSYVDSLFFCPKAPLCKLHPDPQPVPSGPPRRPAHPARATHRDGDGRLELQPHLLHSEQHGQLGHLVPGKRVIET